MPSRPDGNILLAPRVEGAPQDEVPPETNFTTAFQFVRSDDARKASVQKRTHVMREYRRRERWIRERAKQQEKHLKHQRKATGENDPDRKAKSYGALAEHAGRKRSVVAMKSQFRYRTVRPATSFEPRKRDLVCQRGFSITSTPPPPLLTSDGPVLDCFTDRFVDAFAPVHRETCGSSGAIRNAAVIRVFSPLLLMAFNAVSTTFAGRQTGNMGIISAGRLAYVQVLEKLQSALAHPVYSRSEAVLATVVLLVAYESMENTTREALQIQCAGMLQLIQFRGPRSHVSGLEHLCFAELRPYWVYASLILRKPSFLSKPEWKSIPWSSAGTTKDIMQHLMDHVVDISTLLYESDMLSTSSKTKNAPGQPSPQQRILWQRISEVESSLRRWKLEWADEYPSGQPSEKTYGDDQTIPVFRYRDPSTSKTITPPGLTYPDPQLCRCLCTFWASMIVLASIDTRPRGAIQPQQAFEWACRICRSMQYFILNVSGNMTSRMAFPLAAAHEALPKEGIERKFISDVNLIIGRRKVSRIFIAITPGVE